jgi:hypothetical protein
MSMAIDRALLVEIGYGQAAADLQRGPGTRTLRPTTTACLTQDIEGAIALLDEAGIVDSDGDGVREKDGVPLRVLYQTSTNAVRQDFQALIKAWWADIGIEPSCATSTRRCSSAAIRLPGHVPEVLCRRRDVRQQLRRCGPAGLHGELAVR